jgi:4-hydroxybenzoate polyprenyltransferase
MAGSAAGRGAAETATVREGQTLGGASRFVRYANFVRLPHTVFALPFALVGATFASYGTRVTWAIIGWIVVAFTSARFAAMGFNRIVDREIDARNPRTSRRELPSGRLGVREASLAVIVAAAVFVYAAARLNPLCGWLAPLALGWVLFYSYTKRFTHWSHLVLGVSLGIAPVGGFLAVAGHWSAPWWMLPVLALAVTTWVAGFDILYALQDQTFDLAQGLYSIPVTFGDIRAFFFSRVLHLVTVLSLGLVGWATHAGILYAVGLLIAAALLLYEHSLVSPRSLGRLDAAFFTMNGVISIAFFVFVLAERLVRLRHGTGGIAGIGGGLFVP